MISVLGFGDNAVDKYEHKKIMYPGGNCVNFVVYAKQFGVQTAAYMGLFGSDPEAEHILSVLHSLGIETTRCRQVEGENGYARVMVTGGERVFLYSNEGGIRKRVPFILDRQDLEYIYAFDLVHSSCYSYIENELCRFKELGIPISFDFSDDSTPESVNKVAPYIDFAFISFGNMDVASIQELPPFFNRLRMQVGSRYRAARRA